MARTPAELPAGPRLTDHISLGVLTASFPIELVRAVLANTGRGGQRERDLPAHMMVYYAIALALYADVSTREVLRCLLEGFRWLGDPEASREPAVKSAISQARSRLGSAPLEALYRAVVKPIAKPGTPGAWYRDWRVMSLDGSTLDVADTVVNTRAFGRPGSGRGKNATGAFPQLRLVGLVETGTHIICAAQLGAYGSSESALAPAVLAQLDGEMLCLADRGFLGFDLWRTASATPAALLWRASATFGLPVLERLSDGSYLSELRWNSQCKSENRTPIPVRVIKYRLPQARKAPSYRVVTNILEPERAPATELATLYHERWEIEDSFDEFKTHLRGAQHVLRSKTPDLVQQEAWGFLLAHFALRALMYEAALDAPPPHARDPDTLSFTHALRVTRRTLPHLVAIPPSGPGARSQADHARTAGGTGRQQPRPRRASRRKAQDE